MARTLEVTVNRERPNVLEVPDRFETTTDFAIRVSNEGQPVHLHVNCDDDLLAGLSLETGNHYIPREDEYRIPVTVEPTVRPFQGKCRISIGYGSETRYVDVSITKPDQPEAVTVDESLAQPSRDPSPPTLAERILSDTLMLGLLFVAFIVLIAGAIVLASVTTPILGVIVVIVVMLLAVGVYLLVEEA